MTKADAPQVLDLLNSYLANYDLACLWQSVAEVEHWFLPRDDVIYTYIVENEDKKVTGAPPPPQSPLSPPLTQFTDPSHLI